jgi:hypothetical protein
MQLPRKTGGGERAGAGPPMLGNVSQLSGFGPEVGWIGAVLK